MWQDGDIQENSQCTFFYPDGSHIIGTWRDGGLVDGYFIAAFEPAFSSANGAIGKAIPPLPQLPKDATTFSFDGSTASRPS